ncbi:hypothetical protein GCM10022415_15620 [Knoellia locipacati]|uniref:Phosphatidic acid phosphatase type 2/haloperoxidase domain-containing protein n=1 Tax=Knoellia locipacati TaxID=882824 RepID=A0A512SZZ1_9MICO|nr:phosphatase PAP2 family protein [Knoellia locipacati]GEQ13512.1 hypothetical protein KLO01_15590 [Knoellia locipacati]
MTSEESVQPARSRLRRVGRAVVYGLVVAVVVTALAFLVRSQFDPLIRADTSAIRTATDVTREHPALRQFLLTWQLLSNPTNLYVLAALACLWTWRRRQLTTRALWAFVTMMVGWNLALDVKYIVQRARPIVADPVSHAPGYSFPSGHAANATIAATTMVLLFWPLMRRTGVRVGAVVAAALFVLVTCLDRIFLGVHFPSDVVGGVLLGAGLVLSSYAGYVDWRPPALEPDSATRKEPT